MEKIHPVHPVKKILKNIFVFFVPFVAPSIYRPQTRFQSGSRRQKSF